MKLLVSHITQCIRLSNKTDIGSIYRYTEFLKHTIFDNKSIVRH